MSSSAPFECGGRELTFDDDLTTAHGVSPCRSLHHCHSDPRREAPLPPPPRPPRPPSILPLEPWKATVAKGGVINTPIGFSRAPVRRRWYPATQAGRRIFWVVFVIVAIIIIAIVALVGTLASARRSPRSQSSIFGERHPLSPEQGGVSVGKPGDIATFGNRSRDFFLLRNARSSFVTRLDPIVNPGSVASHLHRVHGSSYFTPDLISASKMQKLANCSTTQVQKDLSLYWVPTVHYMYPNGSLINVPVRYTSIYYFQKAPTGTEIHPFPDNYNIVVGDPNRRARNESNDAEQAVFWYCFRGGGNDLKTWDFPPSQCKDGLTSVIIFPSCWDGQAAHTYAKHTAYPVDGPNGHRCPPDFPKKLVTIQFETACDVSLFPYIPGRTNWILANGDTTGFGVHGDFMNGWDPTTFQAVLDQCRYMNATDEYSFPTDPHNCPALNASYNLDAALSCRSQTPIINEAVGNQVAIPHLPGCNGLWAGTGPKPPCPPGQNTTEPGFVQPSVWYKNEGYVA